MNRKIKAVIFDLDGTLIDSMGIWEKVDLEYLGKRGIIPPDNLFDDLKGGNSFTEVAQYFKDKFNLADSIEEIMSEWHEMVEQHYSKEVNLKPFVKELLLLLKNSKLRLAVGSSNSLKLAQASLKKNGVLELFDAFVTGEENIKGKPFPDIFDIAAKRLNINNENCLVIEDVLAGIRAAKNAKMEVFAIYDKHSQKEQNLIMKEADRYFYSFEDIILELKRRMVIG